MPPQARRQYSAAFKRKVILYAEDNNSVAAEKEFGISEKCVRGWRQQKVRIFACPGTRRSFPGPKQGRYPAVEEKVLEWVLVQRKESLSVSYEDIEMKLRDVARDLNIPLSDFKISKKWITNFMKRKGLSLWHRTTVSQELPEAYDGKWLEFRRYVEDLRRRKRFLLGQIVNADQTPVWFDMPSRRTVAEKGEHQVRLLTTGNKHNRFTVMLCCTADGHKLPPFLVFKRKTLPKEKFPPKVIVRVNEKGFFNEETVLEWFRLVWCRRPGALPKLRSILVLDSFRGHMTDRVKKAVANANATADRRIPQQALQGPSLQGQALQGALYDDWMKQDNPKTPTGRVKRPPLSTVVQWVNDTWYGLPDDMVRDAFVKCSILAPLEPATSDDDSGDDTDELA